MPYSNFTLETIEENFGVTNKFSKLFPSISTQEPSSLLKETLQETSNLLSLSSEKEKSEAIIFPIIFEMKRKNPKKISIFSGRRLDVDSTKGLVGECDFIISNKPNLFDIGSPVIAVIEAKKDDFSQGIAQCIAQMIGSRVFNEKKDTPVDVLYGCVTNAREWQFLSLESNIVTVDSDIYYLNQIPEILGIFQMILDKYK